MMLSEPPTYRIINIVVIPRIQDYKYLNCLYSEVLSLSNKSGKKIRVFSPQTNSTSMAGQLLYPFKVFSTLNRHYKNTTTILHVHWIEFLYRWGNHRFLIPLLIPIMLSFLTAFKRSSENNLTVTVHNVVPHETYFPSLESAFFTKVLKDLADSIFVHSLIAKKFLLKNYDVDSKKIRVIQHGLFNNPKKRSAYENKIAKESLGISRSDIVFSFLGSVSEYKGVTVLLRAIKNHLKEQPSMNIKFIIAGEIKRDYLNLISKEFNNVLQNRQVLFIKRRLSEKEFQTILDATDIGVCPYIKATTPATVLDFACHYLPIITTNDPNVNDILGDYPRFIIKPNDYLSLANAFMITYENIMVQKENNESYNLFNLTNAWQESAKATVESYLTSIGN